MNEIHPNVVLLVAVAAVLWLAARGRLAALVGALEGKAGGSPLQPSDALGAGAAGDSSTNIYPGAHPFGLSKVTSSFQAPARYWQGQNAPDRGLLPSEAGEWNYMLPYGAHEPVFLPDGGKGWKLGPKGEGNVPDMGGYEDWQGPGGAEIVFLHLSDLWDPTSGTGGIVGTTGAPTPGSAYSAQPAGADIKANEHLAVIYNKAAEKYLS